jgi:hypothetical protein
MKKIYRRGKIMAELGIESGNNGRVTITKTMLTFY